MKIFFNLFILASFPVILFAQKEKENLGDKEYIIVKDYLYKEPIYPWAILPGYYLQVTDFGIQEPYLTNLRNDPRSRLIENVKYTAPWSLDISGGKTDRLSSMLAQITMSGGLN